MDLITVDKLLDTCIYNPIPPDPINGKIYCLTNDVTDIKYIGSTMQSLDDRYIQHLRRYREWLTTSSGKKRKYRGMSSYKVFKDGYTTIKLVEHYPTESIRKLKRRAILLNKPVF